MCDFNQNRKLYDELQGAFRCALSPDESTSLLLLQPGILETVGDLLIEDLAAYALRDPASNGRSDIIIETYTSFKAVIYHRLAHQVLSIGKMPRQQRELIAHKLSNMGKLLSGVEIHPAANIGRRFVIDHGYGTVIGETCKIGNDCYILNGVILGAKGIGNNPIGKRHPQLGNNVEIGAGTKVLGSVVIGDNVFLSPGCVILHNVPSNTSVCIVNQLQLERTAGTKHTKLYNTYCHNGFLHLIGANTNQLEVSLLDANYTRLEDRVLELTVSEEHHSQYRVICQGPTTSETQYPINLLISSPSTEIILIKPPGLNSLVRDTHSGRRLERRAS